MKKKYFLLCCIIITGSGTAQNLVPNPSMEDTTISCSQWLSNPYPPGNVAFWFCPNNSTPDYFNMLSCGGVPSNTLGFQYPRTGNAYVGIWSYRAPPPIGVEVREYVACQLLQPLEPNKKYCVSFYVSFSEKWNRPIDGIGALFTQDTATCFTGNYCLITTVPQVSNPVGNVLSDTTNWMLLSGELIAVGGEKFLTLGNFTPDTNLIIGFNSAGVVNGSYYYIDDVSVVLIDSDSADADGDKIICPGENVQIGTIARAGCSYQWQPTTGLSDANVAQPITSPLQTTTYILTLTDTFNATICANTTITTDTVIVSVRTDCPPTPEEPIEAYNIFTPNGDLKNDVFYIKNLPANSSLKIFNRWGNKVFESENYQNNWNGDNLPDGTYFYILSHLSKGTYRGFVEIRR